MTELGALNRGLVTDVATYVGSWIGWRRQISDIPGVQVAVLHDNEIVFTSGYGMADLNSRVPVTNQTRFRVASHSKMFTALAVMRLREQGVLRLDDPLNQWVPDVPDPLGKVTIRELMGHQGGVIRDGDNGNFWQLYQPFPSHEQWPQVLGNEAATYPANTEFKYSNIGYGLLGRVIEAATHTSYAQHITEAIIQPLGLANTTPDYTPEHSQSLATGYSQSSPHLPRRSFEHIATGTLASATGAISTAEDLCRFAASLFSERTRLISGESRRLLHRHESTPAGHPTTYGLGFTRYTVNDRQLVGHSGGFPGFVTQTMWDPDKRLAISVMTNTVCVAANDFTSAFFRLLDLAGKDEQAWHRHHRAAPDVETAMLDQWCGRYTNIWGTVDLARFGNRVFVLFPDESDPASTGAPLRMLDSTHAVLPTSNGYGAIGETVQLLLDDGQVIGLDGPCHSTYLPWEVYREQLKRTDQVRQGWQNPS